MTRFQFDFLPFSQIEIFYSRKAEDHYTSGWRVHIPDNSIPMFQTIARCLKRLVGVHEIQWLR